MMTATSTTPREQSSSIFDWNNQACFAMQQGRYNDASTMFVQILSHLRTTRAAMAAAQGGGGSRQPQVANVAPQTVNEHEQVQEEQEEEGAAAAPSLPLLSLLTVPASVDLQAAHAYRADTTTSTTNRFVLYDQSFVTALPLGQEQHNEEVQQLDANNCLRFVMAFVNFNLGLCAILQSIMHSTTGGRGVEIAKQAHVRALKHLGEYRDPQLTQDALLLKMALYNNLGFLYEQESELEEARRCSKQIEALVTTGTPDTTTPWRMSPQDWDFFAHSSFILTQGDILPLSPAA